MLLLGFTLEASDLTSKIVLLLFSVELCVSVVQIPNQ